MGLDVSHFDITASGKEAGVGGWTKEKMHFSLYIFSTIWIFFFFFSVQWERPQLECKVLRDNLNQEMHRMEVGEQHLGSSFLFFFLSLITASPSLPLLTYHCFRVGE